jgi:serine/threonine protein kinase
MNSPGSNPIFSICNRISHQTGGTKRYIDTGFSRVTKKSRTASPSHQPAQSFPRPRFPKLSEKLDHYVQQWHVCADPCDGFDCQFLHREDPPLTELCSLGQGSSGYVMKVRCRRNCVMALKVMHWRSRQSALEEIKREVRILRSLQHMHIVRAEGSYIKGRTIYGLLLAPAAECDLSVYLDRVYEDGSVLDPTNSDTETLLTAAGCLASALAFIHRSRIKHKDIKPKNILYHENRLLFTDFGISTEFSDHERSSSTGPTSFSRQVSNLDQAASCLLELTLHLPQWAAPEVMNGGQRSRASDIFSFGCVLLEIYSVLALKSPMEFSFFRTDEDGSDAFYKNMCRVRKWVDLLKENLEPRTRDFLEFLATLALENPKDRPTANDVFERARSTKRDDFFERGPSTKREDEFDLTFCGACCQDVPKASEGDLSTSTSSSDTDCNINCAMVNPVAIGNDSL